VPLASVPDTADASPPAQPTMASAPIATFDDPFKYCGAIDTIDMPDNRFSGPAVPHAIAAALQLPDDTAADQVRWRCTNRTVFACNAKHSAACELTPTVDIMIGYCTQHPDTQDIPAPNGSWSCSGTHPVIPQDQKWPVDIRGFYPGAWIRVAPTSSG
jgi:hypothetical protein